MGLFLQPSNSPGFHFTLEAQLCFVRRVVEPEGHWWVPQLIYGLAVQKPGADLPGG